MRSNAEMHVNSRILHFFLQLIFSYVGMDNPKNRIDDRQSFKRARHRQQKKFSASRVFRLDAAVTARTIPDSHNVFSRNLFFLLRDTSCSLREGELK